jgi:predicted RND superfamily exporter protein
MGQVLSIASTYKAVMRLNDDQPFDTLKLQLLHSFVPDDLKSLMMRPYLSDDGNQVRFSIRVIDSQENLERKVLLEKIERDLVEKFNLDPEQIRPSSFVVLYNNMLQSLFESQFNTLGFVFLGILAMFLVLFRNIKIALIAIVPNMFAAGVIIGLMGLIGLPLDLMTITVAAITIGIGVDDTIHYVHRFREEFKKDGLYIPAMVRSHSSIGMALYYTSLTIIFGFSILVVSNFMPTVHFGVLTGLAMFVALIANLTLLPVLLVALKVLGPEKSEQQTQYNAV